MCPATSPQDERPIRESYQEPYETPQQHSCWIAPSRKPCALQSSQFEISGHYLINGLLTALSPTTNMYFFFIASNTFSSIQTESSEGREKSSANIKIICICTKNFHTEAKIWDPGWILRPKGFDGQKDWTWD